MNTKSHMTDKAKRKQDEVYGDAALEAIKERKIIETAQRLIPIWENRIPALPSEKLYPLTRGEKVKLWHVFNIVFWAKLDRWSKFVDLIAESNFLMGRYKYSHLRSSFGRVTLSWVLMPENCLLVKAGAYSNDNFDENSLEYGCYGGYLTPSDLASSMQDELEYYGEDGDSVSLSRIER